MAISPEILRRIEEEVKKVLAQQGMASEAPPAGKRILAIFDAAQIDLSIPLQQLDKCLQQGYTVTAILSDLAAKLLDTSRIRALCGDESVFVSSEIANLQFFTENFSRIVIPILSYPMAAKLTLGMADTPCTYLIFQAMCRRDRIVATSQAFEISTESEIPTDIRKLGQNYIQTLTNFGVQFVAMDGLAETILSNGAVHFRSMASGGRQSVISASVIASLAPETHEFAYSNPAIITPLARDLAAKKGIRLIARTK